MTSVESTPTDETAPASGRGRSRSRSPMASGLRSGRGNGRSRSRSPVANGLRSGQANGLRSGRGRDRGRPDVKSPSSLRQLALQEMHGNENSRRGLRPHSTRHLHAWVGQGTCRFCGTEAELNETHLLADLDLGPNLFVPKFKCMNVSCEMETHGVNTLDFPINARTRAFAEARSKPLAPLDKIAQALESIAEALETNANATGDIGCAILRLEHGIDHIADIASAMPRPTA